MKQLPARATDALNLLWEALDSHNPHSVIHDRKYLDAWETICELAHTGAAMGRLPEGTGVVKSSHGFADLKRKGHPENDEWHTCGKIFLNPKEAAQTILDQE